MVALERTPALASDAASVASSDWHNEAMASYLAKMTPEERRLRDAQERENREVYPELKEIEVRLNEARARIVQIGPLEKPLRLDKSWHLLHYLMTGQGWDTAPKAPDAAGPGGALLTGQPLGDDVGYGPARLHGVTATAAFARFLEAQDIATLQSRVNLRSMRAKQIYAMPMGPGGDAAYEADMRAEVGHIFPLMRTYVVEMARKRFGLLIWLN